MRLLNISTLQLQDFRDQDRPPYAIASHRWGTDEATFQDVQQMRNVLSPGYTKILGFTQMVELMNSQSGPSKALGDLGLRCHCEWLWIDTCCINKEDGAELSESINSMFRWYGDAAVCYAYLADVHTTQKFPNATLDMMQSQWFNRGWTLQELIAPRTVVFCDRNWGVLGHKCRYSERVCKSACRGFGGRLNKMIAQITGIPVHVLGMDRHGKLLQISVEQKMSWAKRRITTRVEDQAYCLLGLLNVFIAPIYGEGDNAWARLLQALDSKRSVHSSPLRANNFRDHSVKFGLRGVESEATRNGLFGLHTKGMTEIRKHETLSIPAETVAKAHSAGLFPTAGLLRKPSTRSYRSVPMAAPTSQTDRRYEHQAKTAHLDRVLATKGAVKNRAVLDTKVSAARTEMEPPRLPVDGTQLFHEEKSQALGQDSTAVTILQYDRIRTKHPVPVRSELAAEMQLQQLRQQGAADGLRLADAGDDQEMRSETNPSQAPYAESSNDNLQFPLRKQPIFHTRKVYTYQAYKSHVQAKNQATESCCLDDGWRASPTLPIIDVQEDELHQQSQCSPTDENDASPLHAAWAITAKEDHTSAFVIPRILLRELLDPSSAGLTERAEDTALLTNPVSKFIRASALKEANSQVLNGRHGRPMDFMAFNTSSRHEQGTKVYSRFATADERGPFELGETEVDNEPSWSAHRVWNDIDTFNHRQQTGVDQRPTSTDERNPCRLEETEDCDEPSWSAHRVWIDVA